MPVQCLLLARPLLQERLSPVVVKIVMCESMQHTHWKLELIDTTHDPLHLSILYHNVIYMRVHKKRNRTCWYSVLLACFSSVIRHSENGLLSFPYMTLMHFTCFLSKMLALPCCLHWIPPSLLPLPSLLAQSHLPVHQLAINSYIPLPPLPSQPAQSPFCRC